MKIVAVVQARMGSTRLPGKVMEKVNGTPLIELLLQRLSGSKFIEKIVLASSEEAENNDLADHVSQLGYRVYRGSEDDILDRYYNVAVSECANTIVRITGDCPLIDSQIVDAVIQEFIDTKADYVSNIDPPSFPDGLDVEVFTFSALEDAWKNATKKSDREHVTSFIRQSHNNCTVNLQNSVDYSDLRWTLDEPADLVVIRKVFEHFHPEHAFSWRSVLKLVEKQPGIFMTNSYLTRNAGAHVGTGQKLWERAKTIIPGGNMLLSKRAEMFLPKKWPSYFNNASGCEVWDLDQNRFIDMSIMGVGTNLLGYGREEVDQAVLQAISLGNMSTLNCPEEVYLAEKLIELHPWADMVRFARTGGEANAVAVRIARAACGRNNVAVCGYHGWHDWYLAANVGGEDNLSGHLLNGLEANGVPPELKNYIYTFKYNDFDELCRLVDECEIGVIKMEVARSQLPSNSFLQKIRRLADKKDIVLIFDECTSGFRQSLGGLHKVYGVEPDIAVFGKALGNGYAITAIIGRRSVMDAAQSTFISSTFWTERIGPVAGLKVLEVMEKEKTWEQVTETGLSIISGWKQLAREHNISLEVTGLPSLPGFSFSGPNALAYKTLITQEMLAKGYLAATSVYVCTEHTSEIVSNYLDALDSIFSLIKRCEDGQDISTFLTSDICHDNFSRLN